MTKKDNLPWTLKYSPETPDESCVSADVADKVRSFLQSFNPKDKKKALILYGPSGSGKTSLVYAAASVLDAEVLEINASDSRNKNSMKELLGPAIHQTSLFGKTKIILVDEIEGMSGTKDRGGATELQSLLKESSFPIIMTAEDPFDSKFSKLRTLSKLVEFKKIPFDGVKSVLKNITDHEHVEAEAEALGKISRLSDGDVRGSINDLQASISGNDLKVSDINDENKRDTTDSIPQVLRTIMKSSDPQVLKDSLYNFDGNMDDIFMWLDYNLPKEYDDPEDLALAYEYMSKADIYNSRIRARQYWRYLVYINTFLGMGVGLSKGKANPRFVKYEQNSRILKIWMSKRKYAKRDAIAKKIADSTHWSTSEVIKNFGFYKSMAKDPAHLEKIAAELGLDADEKAYLRN